MAATVVIFADYPERVMVAAIRGIVTSTDYPTLRTIKEVCDEIYEPILRREEYDERQRARACMSRYLLPRPQRTPAQQAEVDAQVSSLRKKHGIPESGLAPRTVALPPSADAPYYSPVPKYEPDGKHALRVTADLDKRHRGLGDD